MCEEKCLFINNLIFLHFCRMETTGLEFCLYRVHLNSFCSSDSKIRIFEMYGGGGIDANLLGIYKFYKVIQK